MALTFDTMTVAALLAVTLAAGLSRGFSGFGAALIFVPLASALVGPKLAGPVLAIIDIVFAAYLIPAATRLAERKAIGLMFAGALVGIPAGTAVLRGFEALTLRWLIAAMAAAMLVLLLSGWRYHGRPHVSATVAVGGISGLFSGIAQIGGPPVVAYWLGLDANPALLRANVIVYFALSSVLTIVSYFWAGLFSADVMTLALLTGPVYGIGTFLGGRLFGLASPGTFRTISLALIALAIVTSLPLWGR